MRKSIKNLVVIGMLALVLGTSAMVVSAASANVTKTANASYSTRCQTFDRTWWWAMGYAPRVTGQICYNGSRVWVNRIDCSYFYMGASVTQTWCGTDVNNNSYVEVGSNYQVEMVLKGSPAGWPGYYRVRFNANGAFIGDSHSFW